MRHAWFLLVVLLSSSAIGGCASSGPPLALRKVVLYRSGMGYFERTGRLKQERLRLPLRQHEVDDVLKTLAVLSRDGDSSVGAVAALTARGEEGDVDLELTVARPGEVTLSYAVPTPSWRSTYKLVLGEGEEALLQSWAVVDNVSDEDWRGVRLTLATGAPFSFAVDLHTPRFTSRPDATGRLVESGPLDVVLAERTRPPGSGNDEATGGDGDSDRIPDARDKCPKEPETYNGVEDEDGCPDKGRVIVRRGKLEILDNIYFAAGSRAVPAVAAQLMDAIAATIKGNPQLRSIEVQGHAAANESDAVGLAVARAQAVRDQLVSRGVQRDRLIARGYGAQKPLSGAQNSAENRRVSFLIVKRTVEDEGAAAPAPVEATVQAVERSQRAVSAVQHEVAGMVRHDIQIPVDIPRRSSATLAILNRRISGSEVFLYRPDPAVPGSALHPLRVARFACPPETALEPGPIALYARGSYVGDALVDRLHAGQVSLVPFAIDSSAVVNVERDDRRVPQRLVKIEQGVLTLEDRQVHQTRYQISTGQTAPARILIKHLVRPGYSVRRLPAGTEPGDEAHLIPVALRPRDKATLVVDEEQPVRRTVRLLEDHEGELPLYLSGTQLPAPLAGKVQAAIALRTDLSRIEAQQTEVEERLQVSSDRSAELRDSLKAIEKNTRAEALRRDLTGRLAEAIKANEGFSKKLAELGAERAEKRALLAAALQDLRLEESAP
jgi:outer membrane protein OmpA-like peptidoglycan-associated protein